MRRTGNGKKTGGNVSREEEEGAIYREKEGGRISNAGKAIGKQYFMFN